MMVNEDWSRLQISGLRMKMLQTDVYHPVILGPKLFSLLIEQIIESNPLCRSMFDVAPYDFICFLLDNRELVVRMMPQDPGEDKHDWVLFYVPTNYAELALRYHDSTQVGPSVTREIVEDFLTVENYPMLIHHYHESWDKDWRK
jgi:hypothetical protein